MGWPYAMLPIPARQLPRHPLCPPLFSPRVFLMAIPRAGEHLQKGSGVVFQSCS